ncbi:GntR family transcriptional regulator [Rothia uropygialis]|uniref:GntR family transcriptional regulator n=1 Tax=Kocuria sp. 36 TaxID=1415402 RepID=UPI0013EA3074|nr:GntR family transcriptional regulator [Kocuria sp. 36]
MMVAAKKYQRVQQAIRRDYGQLRAGTSLPSEAELCRQYEVSRVTIRRAIEELVDECLLTRQHGRGTFVSAQGTSPTHPPEIVDSQGFYAQMTGQGIKVTSKVLFQGITTSLSGLANSLGLSPQEPLLRLDRVRSVEGRIDHLTRSWMSARKYRGILDHNFARESLQAVLSEEFGFTPRWGRANAQLTDVTREEAEHLGIQAADTRLRTFITFYADNETPEVCTETIYADKQASPQFLFISRS